MALIPAVEMLGGLVVVSAAIFHAIFVVGPCSAAAIVFSAPCTVHEPALVPVRAVALVVELVAVRVEDCIADIVVEATA